MMRLKLPVIDEATDYEAHLKDSVWQQAAAVICARHGLPYSLLRRSPQGENIIFFVDERFVIKIFLPLRDSYAREKAALEFASGRLLIETPELLYAGDLEGWPYLVMTQLAGLPAREAWPEIDLRGRLEIVSCLGRVLKSLHKQAAPLSQTALNRDWRGFIERQAKACVERQRACGANSEWLKSLPGCIAARIGLLPEAYEPVMLHGDVHLGNLLLAQERGRWQIKGLFDFGDSFCGFHEYDFVAPGVLMVQGSSELQKALLLAYGYQESQLDMSLRARLMLLTILYECSDLRKYALRLRPDAINLKLAELEAAIWTFATE